MGFSEELDKLTIGDWQGPICSGFGIHLIRLAARTEGRLPELAEIRSVVQREWSNEKRIANRRKINDRLLEDYEVIIEWPEQKVAAQISGEVEQS
jgi:parvulin-like peptidyl-prolyl isomerase